MKDTEEILKCPACSAEMKKVFIKSTNFNVDICIDGCGGILFDNREFKHFDEPHESMEKITEALKGKTFEKQDESKTRICPVCLADNRANFVICHKIIFVVRDCAVLNCGVWGDNATSCLHNIFGMLNFGVVAFVLKCPQCSIKYRDIGTVAGQITSDCVPQPDVIVFFGTSIVFR